jgi:hypothetical protein
MIDGVFRAHVRQRKGFGSENCLSIASFRRDETFFDGGPLSLQFATKNPLFSGYFVAVSTGKPGLVVQVGFLSSVPTGTHDLESLYSTKQVYVPAALTIIRPFMERQ